MYQVEIANSGDYTFKAKSKDYAFMVDLGGKGMTPPDVLLASLGACMGVYLRKYAEGAKLALPEFKLLVSAEFAKEEPICFRKIKVEVDLKGTRLDERRQKSLLEFIQNCPVHRTLKSNPEVEVSIR